MGGRIYEATECLRYSPSAVPAPTIGLTLRDLSGRSAVGGEFQVDTGFEGDVLVPWDEYVHFQTAELPEDLWRRYRTVSGIVVGMRCARALAEVGGGVHEVLVETPLLGEGRRLVGRGLLRRLRLALDGPDLTSCLLSRRTPAGRAGSVGGPPRG